MFWSGIFISEWRIGMDTPDQTTLNHLNFLKRSIERVVYRDGYVRPNRSGVARGDHWAIAQCLEIYCPKIFGDDGYCPVLKISTEIRLLKTQSSLVKFPIV